MVLTCSLSMVPAGGPEVGGRGTSHTMGKATLVLPPCKGGEGRKRGRREMMVGGIRDRQGLRG